MQQAADVIIVGAGPAGLSAALVLGRCRRRVLLFDHGKPRNAGSRALHGFLTRDGIAPAELRRIGREQLERYASVALIEAEVTDAAREADGFSVRTRDGRVFGARKLLLAAGVVDELPRSRAATSFTAARCSTARTATAGKCATSRLPSMAGATKRAAGSRSR